MERKKELGGNFYLNLVVRDAPESAKAHDTDTDHRSEKKGNSFNECTTTPTIVDLMNPFMGLYAIPTVGQYRQDGYPSGELKVCLP